MKFQHPEDKEYFSSLLCFDNKNIEEFECLFDFRDPKIKRKEFNKMRNAILKAFLKKKGMVCELNFKKICDIKSGLNIDHLIPLSSNKLNKEIRRMKAKFGRKVISQIFGSNHKKNLLLTCKRCNAHKKHRLLAYPKIQAILQKRF